MLVSIDRLYDDSAAGLGATPNLLLRVGIFSDEREVEQHIGEVLIGHRAVGKHAGAGMSLPNGAGALLVGFQAQSLRIP